LNFKPAILLALACLVPLGGRAQQLYTGAADLLPLQVDRMYLKGMDYLVHTQLADGSWADATGGPAAIWRMAMTPTLALTP
jgi:hypothetical protein